MPSFKSGEAEFHYWWVQQNRFLAGQTPVGYESYNSKQYLSHLLDLGMRTFISLQEEDEVSRKPFAFYHDALERLSDDKGVETSFVRVPAMDGSTLNDRQLTLLLDMIDASLQRNAPVYLHCMAGHGRTGTVVGCWLARHGLTGAEALAKITALRADDPHFGTRPSPQKPRQIAKVKSWKPAK
ncbi:MAG: dual specificity protein phosphatase family protein [Cellvibrionaceae bacterium]